METPSCPSISPDKQQPRTEPASAVPNASPQHVAGHDSQILAECAGHVNLSGLMLMEWMPQLP